MRYDSKNKDGNEEDIYIIFWKLENSIDHGAEIVEIWVSCVIVVENIRRARDRAVLRKMV